MSSNTRRENRKLALDHAVAVAHIRAQCNGVMVSDDMVVEAAGKFAAFLEGETDGSGET